MVYLCVYFEVNMVLIEVLKDGKLEVCMFLFFIVYNEEGIYCDEIMDIYYGL